MKEIECKRGNQKDNGIIPLSKQADTNLNWDSVNEARSKSRRYGQWEKQHIKRRRQRR